MTTATVSSPGGITLQECGKSTEARERGARKPESYSLRKGKTLREGTEEKALRKRIRHFRLEHDRQAKSLTRDLMEMKECLQNISSGNDEKKTSRRKEDKREGTESRAECKQATEELATIEEDPKLKIPANPCEGLNKDNNTKHQPLASSSEPSVLNEGKAKNIVAIQGADSSPAKVLKNRMVDDEELMVSLSESSLRGVKEKTKLEKIAQLNLNDITSRTTRRRTESRESKLQPRGENKVEGVSKGSRKKTTNARPKGEEKLYRTSRVTRISLGQVRGSQEKS